MVVVVVVKADSVALLGCWSAEKNCHITRHGSLHARQEASDGP